jgi:hypothetical protein
MRVLLRACSIPEAAAIAELDGKFRLLQPPYALHSSPEMSETDLADALARSGYIRQNKEFSSFRDLISFARQIHEEWLRKVGLPTSGSLSAEDFIAEINPLMIWDVIERIDNDLVKAGLYDQAVALLVSIIKSPLSETNPKVKTRALASLVKVHSERAHGESSAKSEGADLRFSTLQDRLVKEKIQTIKERIRNRHCVFELRADT